jgi:glutaredoxin 3
MSDNANVVVYTAQWCGFCHAVKDYLSKKGVSFTEKDIDTNPAYAEEAVKKSGQTGIPVVEIGDTVIVGFDRSRIDAALAQ